MNILLVICILLSGCAMLKDVPYNAETKWEYECMNIKRTWSEGVRCHSRVLYLSELMHEAGIKHRIVYGIYDQMWDGHTRHCWIEYRDGEILDPAVGWVGVPNEFWRRTNEISNGVLDWSNVRDVGGVG